MAYPETVNLAFNRAVIEPDFAFSTPDRDVPAAPGYWLVLRENDLIARAAPAGGGLELPYGQGPLAGPYAVPPVFVGTWRGRPLRAARLSPEAAVAPGLVAVPAGYRYAGLDEKLLTLAGIARQVLHWRDRSRICPACGGAPREIPGTFGARCPACARDYYPRLHPAVIVLIRRGEEYLLVRKPGWPAGQYGMVAGFVEFAESLEECVVREVAEETGLAVDDIRYVGSQNWPFPSQLMAGFTAGFAGGELRVDTTELEAAAWFSAKNPPLVLPPASSIARRLMDLHAPDMVAAALARK
ncbi:NAD(+) diphosphatase [Solidesulfovibrio sp.]|uniref:NAD(+) diphosphatase n=1 Tax=Solidesulfovibrio sp. TaxID=2910990 RepID=UPI002B203FC9|nr:NAD(+) diphosphatase [Solidesulfovibrio sp.]MEA4858681.1 NAD(+) diphosphatase [Solidesulfovibrio sp.]